MGQGNGRRSLRPQGISIGPFHRKNKQLQPMERFKWRALSDLIARSHHENSLKMFIQELKSLEGQARSCYSDQVVPDDSNAFVEMMLLDGCFIIEFLVTSYTGVRRYGVNWNLTLLRKDLLLLENQIPFFVLQSLFNRISPLEIPGHQNSITLTDLALFYLNNGIRILPPSIPSGVHHLLHLCQSSRCPSPTISFSHKSEATECIMKIKPAIETIKCAIKTIKDAVSCCVFWLLSLLINCRLTPPPTEEASMKSKIPNATELQKAGIKFDSLSWSCFINIAFINGTMKIPQLVIDAETISLFRNLIAFEQCCATAGNHFTAYAALMSNLIKTPGDVALLVRCGILDCQVGSYEEVIGFFDTLAPGGFLNYRKHYLRKLSNKVKHYYAEGIYRYRAIRWWRVMLIDYFSKPWAFISLIAASVLLILTMVQTFFAVLAYYHPPS